MPPARPPAATSSPRSAVRWEVRLLGGISASNGDIRLDRLPSRPIAALLARLVLYPQRHHAREELAELLWPGAEPAVGRNRLRHALSTLRRLLEPPGAPGNVLILADRDAIRLNAQAFDCDAVLFERHVREGRHDLALGLYQGELLPGYYDDWVQDERLRLAALHQRLLSHATPAAPMPRGATGEAMPAPEAQRRLPGYLTTYFGREAECRRLIDDVSTHRLVTLTGPGGCGKTRIAVETARAVPGFDEVAFVALAECRDADQAIDQLRAALGLPAGSGAAIDHVTSLLAGRRTLLVLDNFEQLVDTTAADLPSTLLARLPRLHLLITSRRALQLAGEREFVLPPLPLPEPDDTPAAAARNASVALFIDRARAVRGDFHLGARNLPGLLALCSALEGLPLAIEIAASRVRAYSPQEMCDALAHGLEVLARTGPRAAKDGRHASLITAIDWSWRLLDAPQQRLLSALTVFRGGWTAEGALALLAPSALPEGRDVLEALVVHSLVQSLPDAHGDLRFAMPDSVRQFARAHLTPEQGAAMRARHRRHMLSMAQRSGNSHAAIAPVELPNVAEALATSLADGEPGIAAALALALKAHWLANGTTPEVLRSIGSTIDALPVGDPLAVSLLCMWARMLLQAGHAEQAEAAAVRATERCGDDPALRADALFARTSVAWVWHRDGAKALEPARRALQLAEACGSLELRASASMLLAAITLWHLQDPIEADRLFEAAEALFRQFGDAGRALSAFPGRVACLQARGLHERAIELACVGERRAADQQHVETQLLLYNRASLSYEATRRFDQALECCRLQAHLARRHHMVYHAGLALWNACHPLARLRRAEAAAQLMAFSEAYWVERFGPIDAGDRRHLERVRRLVTVQIGPERWRVLYALGAALPIDEGYALLSRLTAS